MNNKYLFAGITAAYFAVITMMTKHMTDSNAYIIISVLITGAYAVYVNNLQLSYLALFMLFIFVFFVFIIIFSYFTSSAVTHKDKQEIGNFEGIGTPIRVFVEIPNVKSITFGLKSPGGDGVHPIIANYVYVDFSNNKIQIHNNSPTNILALYEMPVNIVLNDDKYHAVIINYESLVPELYVDGKLIYGTGTSPANPPKIGEQLTIGDANVILADLT